jgi:hypothetical protein
VIQDHDIDDEAPHPHIQALTCRLMLALDSGDIWSWAAALDETFQCPEHCATAVIASLTRTLIDVLEEHEPRWRTGIQDALAELLDAADDGL